jgi:protein SCO1/2
VSDSSPAPSASPAVGGPAPVTPAAPPALRALRYGLWALLLMVVSGLVAVWWWGPGRSAAAAARLPVLGEVPDFALVDASGAAVTRASLAGKPWIAGLVFTRCKIECPLLVERMDAVGSELPDDVWRVAVSVDPTHDNPARLREYAAEHDAREPSWLFLTGDEAQVQRLALEGFKLGVDTRPPGDPRAAGEPITHSTRVVLVDGAGRIRGYYDAFDEASTADLIRHARALAVAPGGAPSVPPQGTAAS